MIVVGGDSLIDVIQTSGPDEALSFSGALGGSSYNTVRALGRQSVGAGFLSPLSSDNLGTMLKDGLTNEGVEHLGQVLDAPTTLAMVTLNNGQPTYQFYRDNTVERQVDVSSLQTNMPSDATLFHLASLSIIEGEDADAWARFFISQHEKGIITSLDPNIRALAILDRNDYLTRLHKMLAHVDLLKLSDEDLAWLYPDDEQKAAFQKLSDDSSATMLVLTRGDEGALAKVGDILIEVPAYPILNLRDTVGAGDTFTATLLAWCSEKNKLSRNALSKLNKTELTECIERAAKAAALNCEQVGCNPPTYNQLMES